jgi:hypothetical protein
MADTVIGDKTPGHLYHVPQLMEWFPEAKIVHTFRDPRAILASEWKKRARYQSDRPIGMISRHIHTFVVVLHVTISWLYAVRLHEKYRAKYPRNYCLVKFEDVVSAPEKTIRTVCEFLGIEFHPDMLDPRQFDSSFAIGSGQRATGFDTDALSRWEYHLSPWMKRWLAVVGGKHLKSFGYV